MNYHCKYFPKYLIILLLVPLFGGCISLAPPYKQVKYSNNPHLKTMKEEVRKEEAVGILKIYVKNNTDIQQYFDLLYFNQKITEQSIRENTIITEDSISFDETYRMNFSDLNSPGSSTTKGKPNHSRFVLKYEDVKKIKMYAYQEIFAKYYKIYLYDKSDKMIFWFSVPSKNQGEQKAYELLAALSVLMPQAQEEYIEGDTKSYINPQFK